MTYLLLDLAALAVVVVLAAAAVVVARRRGDGPVWPAVGVAAVALLVMTVVFDNVMIAAGLFHYAEDALVGLRLGRVPVEDLAYPIAVVVLLPALWHALGGGRDARSGRGHR